jgi:hypothetical protein
MTWMIPSPSIWFVVTVLLFHFSTKKISEQADKDEFVQKMKDAGLVQADSDLHNLKMSSTSTVGWVLDPGETKNQRRAFRKTFKQSGKQSVFDTAEKKELLRQLRDMSSTDS